MAQLATTSPSSIVLPGFDPATKRIRCDGDSQYIRDGWRNSVHYQRYRSRPTEWDSCPQLHHPSYWHIYEYFVDDNGDIWSLSITAVTDDFGDLVEVATC